MQKMVARPSIWYLLHFSYIKPYPESQQSEKTHPSKAPVQLPKEAQRMTALNHPNVDKGHLLGANVSSTRSKQTSKVQFLAPKIRWSHNQVHPETMDPCCYLLQKRKTEIAHWRRFFVSALVSVLEPKLGQSARGPHHRATVRRGSCWLRAAKGGLWDLQRHPAELRGRL
jgi:hypothetical protein